MLVVLGILGVLAGMAIPYFAVSTIDELQAAATVVIADIDYARNLAIANGSEYKLTFEPTINRYQLKHCGTNPLLNALPTSPYKAPTDTAATQTTRLDHLPFGRNNIQLLGVLPAFSTSPVSSVTFTSLGSTTQTDDAFIWLAAGSGAERRYVAVRVTAVSGIATVAPLAARAPTGIPGSGS